MDALIRAFIGRAHAADAEVVRSRTIENAAAFLKEQTRVGDGGRVLVAPALAANRALSRDFGDCSATLPPGEMWAAAGIVEADFGVAETGTLVRLEEGDAEKAAWTVPETCYCLLDASKVVGSLEGISPRLKRHLLRTDIPSPQVSLVTGPSRTADIECLLTIGVHGPSKLIVILIGGTDLAKARP